ncbi:hypothetical protein ACIQU6_39830 [Streptomyces sp. NPDC090442]|uniref:hypothetical protein n=1 Tax=Streptomyces sp. NPDC090442 TaxID=3365962 RepID=UPI0037F1F690
MTRVVLVTPSAEDLGHDHQVFRRGALQTIYLVSCPARPCRRLVYLDAHQRLAEHLQLKTGETCDLSGAPLIDSANPLVPSHEFLPLSR